MEDVDHFFAMVDMPSTFSACWLWTGPKFRNGYGRVWFGGEAQAHRLSYRLARGAIAAGLVIDHLCRVRACVSPLHMEPVTNRENLLRGWRGEYAATGACKHGHDLAVVGEYAYPDGRTCCRECRRDAKRRWEKRNA